jgi:hypothetical protein
MMNPELFIFLLILTLLLVLFIFIFNFILIIVHKCDIFEKEMYNNLEMLISNKNKKKSITSAILNIYKKKSNEQKNFITTYVIFTICILLITIYLIVTQYKYIKTYFIKFKTEIITYLILFTLFMVPYYLYGILHSSKFLF